MKKLYIYTRLLKFLIHNNVIINSQFGFQKNKSTEQAVLNICAKIINSFENSKFACCVFLDFAKAFDTVNHQILLKKLNFYGIRGSAYEWFKSYLSNRTQYVKVSNVLSNQENIVCGVPQGSILGPLLFLIYINDLIFSCQEIEANLFADDTALIFSNKSCELIEAVLNKELSSITEWLLANKLTLNIKKI